MAELLACFPVYRSYLPLGVEHLEVALAGARARRPDLLAALDALAPVLSDPAQPAALRFQQTSGMVMAKGVEDCAFYRYPRLTSLNEVGGDPSVFSTTVAEFHEAMAARQRDWPDAMTTLSTHDTKRSEDVRARIAVLAEAPGLWERTLVTLLDAAPAAGPRLRQPALAGGVRRVADLARAAARVRREGDARGRRPDHVDRPRRGVRGRRARRGRRRLRRRRGATDPRGPRRRPRRPPAESNALAAKLLSLTVPGVPDVYQGSELGDLSLVDPDNRRPVDFDAAEQSLVRQSNAKQALTARALRLRRDRPELFTTYTPVLAEGPAAEHVLAFDRGGAVTVVTRLPLGLVGEGRAGARPCSRSRAGGAGSPTCSATTPPPYWSRTGRELSTAWPVRRVGAARAAGSGCRWAMPSSSMVRGEDDWWSPAEHLQLSREEIDYGYLIDDSDTPRPDPRSRRQPAGVHQRSRTHDPTRFAWTDHEWAGRQLAGAVIYELHVGTFTPEGTFDAALTRLDHLRGLGVDFVELMPVNAVNGTHNWGYDGVLWYAVHEPYGGPEGYQRFVDGCHAAGLGVIQDVVHNHLGPSGNYLPEFGPYLKDGANTLGRPGQPRR